jgi:hypothetical protein
MLDLDTPANAARAIQFHFLDVLGVLATLFIEVVALSIQFGLECLDFSFTFVLEQAFPRGELGNLTARAGFILELLPIKLAESSVFFENVGQSAFEGLFVCKSSFPLLCDFAQRWTWIPRAGVGG